MTRILTSDILISDLNTPLSGNPQLKSLVEKYNLTPGGKLALTDEQFAEFSKAVQGHPITMFPGGSSANTVVTLSKLLGKDKVDVQFVGVVGDGVYSKIIKSSLDEVGIKLLPDKDDYKGFSPQTAVSYIIHLPDGENTTVTHLGNAKSILKPDIITDEMVKNTDVLLVQGSLWQKMDWNFADRLLDMRWKNNKELWLALPTNAKFGNDNAKHFQYLITSSNVVLGNDKELARIYQTTPDEALKHLQQAFKEHKVLEREGRNRNRKPVGFITRSEKGAAIVTEDGIEYIPPHAKIDKIESLSGAGDTSFAGFAAGYIQGLPDKTSAQIAMALASEKLRHNGPRLDNPRESLRKASPHLATEVLGAGKSSGELAHSGGNSRG